MNLSSQGAALCGAKRASCRASMSTPVGVGTIGIGFIWNSASFRT
jgi:hypothetical protein